jgi:RNA polymerase sigma-70 factor, ECF subfamily
MRLSASPINRPTNSAERPISYLPVLDEAALVSAIVQGRPGATDALFRKYVDHVRKVIVSVLDIDNETEDILQEVFIDAIRTIDRLEDPSLLRSWLTRIAVFKSREVIRRRTRRRWIRFVAPEKLEELSKLQCSIDTPEAVLCTYLVLGELSAQDRIVFGLRHISGMELTEVAEACQVSLATVKRHLQHAEEKFARRASKYPSLRKRLWGGRFRP